MPNYIVMYGRDTKQRTKARSKRGWTSPTPAQLARNERVKAEADRKLAKERQSAENASKHEQWLKKQGEQQ